MTVKECQSSLADTTAQTLDARRDCHTHWHRAQVVGGALRAFGDDNLIRRERGRLVVVDRAGLEREAMMNG